MTDPHKYRCLAKVIEGREIAGTVVRSRKWRKASRGWLSVFDDRLEYSDRSIDFAEVSNATLYKVWQFPFPVPVLELTTDSNSYQFGLNPWVNMEKHLPMLLERKSLRLRSSALSVIRSVILVAAISYLAWQAFL